MELKQLFHLFADNLFVRYLMIKGKIKMKNYGWIFLLLIGVCDCAQSTNGTASDSTDTSSTATDNSSTSTETSSIGTDTSSTGTDTGSTTTETSSIGTDTSSTATDTSSIETDTSSAGTDSSTTATDTSSTATDTSSTGTGILFGFWGLNNFSDSSAELDAVNANFNATVFQVAADVSRYTIRELGWIDGHMKVTMRLTRDHQYYTTDGTATGPFSLALWKAELDRWNTIESGTTTYAAEVQPYITDGTLVGHMILDDIQNFSVDPTAAELDEMARYSQTLFPGLMTFVRNKATTMPVPTAGKYVYLDACVNQYTNYPGYSDGDITIYARDQAQTALDLGLKIINGMNIADGGDGTSAHLGASAAGSSGIPHYAMTATEITTYGTALLAHGLAQSPIMFLMWEYDGIQVWQDGSIGSNYFDTADVKAALAGLGVLAAEY